jgi:putative FmdB family regulatory protein
MPTYEYICQKCGHQFEKVQPMSAAALTVCPKEDCAQKPWGKGKVKRAITGGAGLLFKGSGFYITDYRSEKYKEAAKKDSSAASSSGGEKKSSGGDSKPVAKPESSKPAPTKT